ncbi:MAG: class I SAM-dependent methyltransferase [Gallionella sp.]|nr:class I SAM-dependent methyltransferase [Gallionella sp.]
MKTQDDNLRALLNVFWLRPETAMWRAIDINAMKSFNFTSPSLDLGCGDGIFSFIRAGGRFSKNFDAFQTVGSLDKFFENVDVFDASDDSPSPNVEQVPSYKIDVGFDHKKNLLSKANKLSLYKELIEGSANQPLPFEDSKFNTIFSNIVYWLDDPKFVFSEIYRVLKPGGKACLMLPNQTFPEFSFYNQLYVKTQNKEWAFLEKLDRGRFEENFRQAKSSKEWENLILESGLSINEHVCHLSKTVIQIWDIGLRPLFPVLLKMAKNMDEKNLIDIKNEWIDILDQFLKPLVKMDGSLHQNEEPAFHCYILEK